MLIKEENIEVCYVENEKEILKILIKFDNVFTPRLSSLIENLEEYAKKLHENAIVLAVKDRENVLGFLAMYANDYENRIAYLTQIAVMKNIQSKNLGKFLLNYCFKIAIENDMSKIKLEVFNANYNAINLYENYGFKFIENASSESMYMIKEL